MVYGQYFPEMTCLFLSCFLLILMLQAGSLFAGLRGSLQPDVVQRLLCLFWLVHNDLLTIDGLVYKLLLNILRSGFLRP